MNAPIRNTGFIKLFPVILILLTGMISVFIRPGNLDASDFMLIAWNPGRELLQTGSVNADYPYPLWTVIAMLPFIVWQPATAMLVWWACNLVMLAASLALFMTLFDWELTPLRFASIVSLAGFFLPTLTSLWLGQLTIFSLLILGLTLRFHVQRRGLWLGVALALSFIKPQVMLLLAGLFLLGALRQRCWRVLLGFGAMMLALVTVSIPFISSARQIIGGGIASHLGTYILKTSTVWGLSMSLGISWIVPLLITLGLLAWLGWVWLPFLKGDWVDTNRMLFLSSAAVTVNLVVIPYSWMHNLALLLLPAGYCVSMILKMKSRARFAWLAALFFVLHPLMLVLFLRAGMPNDTQAYQVLPALMLLPLMIHLEQRINSRRV